MLPERSEVGLRRVNGVASQRLNLFGRGFQGETEEVKVRVEGGTAVPTLLAAECSQCRDLRWA